METTHSSGIYQHLVETALSDRAKPYIKQQCALYLAQKGQFGEAFVMIDEAVRMSGGKITTIRHTQARIKFEANIDIPDDEDDYVYSSLLASMRELEYCHNHDKRTQRHSEYFARFAVRLDDRYNNEDTQELLRKAEKWLAEEATRPGFSNRLSRVLIDVRSHIRRDMPE